jgi:hypothetical protein
VTQLQNCSHPSKMPRCRRVVVIVLDSITLKWRINPSSAIALLYKTNPFKREI